MNLDELSAQLYTDFRRVPKSFLGMLYGDNGSGKSSVALAMAADITAPGKKIIYVDTSQGFSCLDNLPELAARLDGRLFILPFTGEAQLLLLARAIKNDEAGYGQIGCVILDEASSMAQQILDVVVAGRARKDETKEENKADWPDYQIAGNKYRRIHQNFQTIYGCHFISVAHIRSDKVKGIEKLAPNFQPHVGNETRKELVLIGYCENKEYQGGKGEKPTLVRQIQVWNTQFALAKNRLGLEEIYYTPDQVQQRVKEKYATVEEDTPKEIIETVEEIKKEELEPVEVD